jgi:hypothetical protein
MKDLVNRPIAEKRKIHSKNEFELCYLRHQYLRKVDYNPTPEEMSVYSPISERMSRQTFYGYRYLFSIIGMSIEDLYNISRVWTVEFIGLFEISKTKNKKQYEQFCVDYVVYMNNNPYQTPSPTDLQDKNFATFTLFMKQRLEDMVRICSQKSKNIKGLKVEDYIAFYGSKPPPEDIHKLIGDNKAYGFRIIDNRSFKAIKKKVNANIDEPFQFAGSWYVAVSLEPRNLTIADLQGAGLDPYDNKYNMNPEKLLQLKEQEIRFDKKTSMFQNSPNEEKAKTIFDFIEKNEGNPEFEEEITIARKYLRNLGPEYVR